MRILIASAVVGAALLGGCGLTGDDDEAAQEAGDRTCVLVRDGIEAFNRNDYIRTVAKFREAREPAADFARLAGDTASRDLREAVEYYATLPAADYRSAFEDSPEFMRHQETTLGLCTEPGQPVQPQEEELPA